MSIRFQNTSCDGAGPCDPGRVRVLPVSSDPHYGNMILFRNCFDREIAFRVMRNSNLHPDLQFSLPEWTRLAIYGEEKASA